MPVSANENRCLVLLVFAILYYAIAQQIDPPIPCKDVQDCLAFSSVLKNASCKNGFCVCNDGVETKKCSSMDVIHQSNNRSIGPTIFQACKINQDCKFNNSFCNTTISQCECQRDYVLSVMQKTCLKKAEAIDFPCVEDKQCFSFLSNTTCQRGQCNCISGYHYARNGCYKTIDLEGACTQDEECVHIDGAVCTKRGVCDCAAETVINENKKRCLPVAREILENCTENVQCNTTFLNAMCIDRTCQCRNQYHFEPEMNQCFIDKGLDEDCGNTYECYQSESENENATEKAVRCVQNVCVCAENFAREEDKCVNGGTQFRASLIPLFLATIFAFSKQY